MLRVAMWFSLSIRPSGSWRSCGQRRHTSPSVFFSIRIIELSLACPSTSSLTSAGDLPASADWRRAFSSWYSNQVRASVP